MLEIRIVFSDRGHEVDHPDQGVVRCCGVTSLPLLIDLSGRDPVTETVGQGLYVDKPDRLLLNLEALHQLAEDPEVVSAGRTEWLFPWFLSLCLVDTLSPLWLHALCRIKELQEDGEHGSYTASPSLPGA